MTDDRICLVNIASDIVFIKKKQDICITNESLKFLKIGIYDKNSHI